MRVRRRRDVWDVAVIGGGVAGLTAAWHAVRRGLATVLLERAPGHGGQVANVNRLEDWPATGETSGVELAAALAGRLRDEGVELAAETVEHASVEGTLVRIETAARALRARRAIVASGGRLRTLGVPGEERLYGKGVSQCADCDGFFFRGRDVVVVGGGDAALHEALVLAPLCRSVTIVVRGAVRARASYVERACAAANVHFLWDRTVEAILGDGAVSGVRLRNVKSNAAEERACAGVFPFIGSVPDTDFLPAEVARDAGGHVLTDADFRTAVPELYAIGAVRAGFAGDLVAAAGEAAAAARAVAFAIGL